MSTKINLSTFQRGTQFPTSSLQKNTNQTSHKSKPSYALLLLVNLSFSSTVIHQNLVSKLLIG